MIWGRRAAQRATLVECLDELPPYGRILTLRPPARGSVLQSDAVLRALRQYMQDMNRGNEVAPFVGLLIDLMPGPYDGEHSVVDCCRADDLTTVRLTCVGTDGATGIRLCAQ